MGRRVIMVLLLVLARSASADPGNVISWFSNSLNELTFTCQFAVVKVELPDDGVARVRLSTNNVAFSANPSFVITRNWPRPPISVTDGNPLIVSNAGVRVEVGKTPFRLTFRKPNGTVLLDETSSFGLDYRGATNFANFFMPGDEAFYGLGMVFFKPFNYRGQTRRLYNARVETGPQGEAVTDMAAPLMISSKGYGLLMDNTFPQLWDFTVAGTTRWLIRTEGGELNYYVFAGNSIADVLNLHTQATGRSPIPPRWTFGYTQARNGYHNWGDVYSAKDRFRTNDLPCDGLFLDFQWFGSPCDMGALEWNLGAFPNPAQNMATLSAEGIKTVLITEPYINDQKPNFAQGAALKYLMTDDYPSRNVPSTVPGFFCNAGYVDFNNPAARGWWFEKMKPRINEGNAAQWVDLGEPQYDNATSLSDFSYDGKRQLELHNVYNLLWHQALAEGYATNYPNQRLWLYSRSGYAGSQRHGAAIWSNDVGTDWTTFAAHLNAMNNFSLSGFSYFGSDIGGYWPVTIPNDELYLRWFQYGAFSPVFHGHGLSDPGGIGFKAVAPYDFGDPMVKEICRYLTKLRYRLLPYIYTAAKETLDTGLPLCRPLPLAFEGDLNVPDNGTQFLFGPNLMVAPITTEGLTTRSVYLPAGKWIDHWSGATLTGSITTNWPAPLTEIPLFYRDNSITPLGPYVAATQFDDGTQRTLRIYCSTNASYTLYDDDGISNGYRTNAFATTGISAAKAGDAVFIEISGASGAYSNQPSQRTWGIELFCTNAIFSVVADGAPLTNYYLDGAEQLLRVTLPPASITQPHSIQVYLDPLAPPPYEKRIKAVVRPYLDKNGLMWAADRIYTLGSFGFIGGTNFMAASDVANTDDDVLFQAERYHGSFSCLFDAPNGQYEIRLLNSETFNNNPGDRLMNVFIEGQQVLSNFDIFVAAGGKNRAITQVFTNTVADGQVAITFNVVPGHPEPNARVSAIAVRKIADADSDSDGAPDWWEETNGLNKNDPVDAGDDADGDGMSNLKEFIARTNPQDATSVLKISTTVNAIGGFQISWPSVPGKLYRVYRSEDLQSWSPVLPDIPANGLISTWTDPTPLPDKRFYRVEPLP